MNGEQTRHHETNTTPGAPQVSRGSLITVAVVVLIVAVCLAAFGILGRRHAEAKLAHDTNQNAAPPVAMVKPQFEKNNTEIVLPGNMQAFTMAPIYARTTGYVKSWYHDIGSRVKKGELLAIIETPELDQQLEQAKADLATSESNAKIAKITADRYQGLIGQNAVSQQDTDNATSALRAANTQVAAAQANVQRLQELVSFERIVAPFDGVITARNLDIGQLITATGATNSPGAGLVSSSKEVFDISAIDTLRVFVNVPQVNAPDARRGVTASLTLPQYPGESFKGTVVRTSDSVDPTTRTLLVEVDVDNRQGKLLPGSYTEVHLNVRRPQPALVIPVGALILLPDGLHVGVVDSSQHAHIVKVIPGRDMGTSMEILSGLQADQSVIANPPDSLTDGELVHVVGKAAPHESMTGGNEQ